MKKAAIPIVIALMASWGCVAYRVHPLPQVDERPGPSIPLCIVAELTSDRYALGWHKAASFANDLERAGFSLCIVPDIAQVPPDTPVLENYESNTDLCGNPLLMLVGALSLGAIPTFSCDSFGHTFDLRRTRELPATHVDTRFTLPYVYWWFAPPLILLPQFSAPPPTGAGLDRERRALRAAVVDALAK
jgi:hypothetical protein